MLISGSEEVPSIGNLAFTCALYGALGYGLTRIRWWAGIPFLLFLGITLAATLKRLDDFRAIGALPSAFTPHYLPYHVLATAAAASIVLLGMRQQHVARRRTTTSEVGQPADLATREQLLRETPAKPFLLRLLPFFLALWAIIALPLFIAILLSSGSTFTINDVPVSRHEFMQRAGGVLVAFPVIAVLAATSAWGLYRDHRWARPLTILLFVGGVSLPMLSRDPELATPWSAAVLAVAFVIALTCWYFYNKENVVRYYDAIASLRETSLPK
jgi:hypothetical protein